MRKFQAIVRLMGLVGPVGLVGLVSLAPALQPQAFANLPDNPIAFNQCTAKVKVDAARLRSGPSLDSKIVGVRLHDTPLFVTKVCGKWVQVAMNPGDTAATATIAYVAAYLLTFPANEILEQWKRNAPAQTLGKKARVKWASVQYRKYPSAKSATLGHFKKNDEVAVLADLGNGWSLVESQDPDGVGTNFGFIANRGLAPTLIPDPVFWVTPLAKAQGAPPKVVEPKPESLGEYCRRTAWTPELFALELKSQSHRGQDGDGEQNPGRNIGETLIASR